MYLITRGKYVKAKKVLSLIAKLNCKLLPVGRLVTAEEKERITKETSPTINDIAAVSDTVAILNYNNNDEIVANGTLSNNDIDETLSMDNNKTLPNMDNDDLISSDNEYDSELLLDEHTHRRTQIRNMLVSYYHWMLILFKNGWWRTTLLLWYLW